jgi:phosphatidate cytidylyltransferase
MENESKQNFIVKRFSLLSNELKKRIITASVLIPIVIFVIYASQQIFDIFMIVISILMGYEWITIIKNAENSEEKWKIYGLFYILVPCISLIYVKSVNSNIAMYVILICWVTDTAALFVGKTFGGPKLAPTISPGKTWSGLSGGVIASMLMGALFSFLFKESVTFFVFFSGFLAVIEALGDLLESKFKRIFNIKDSGNIIPGHGGVLDRLDGLTLLAPFVALVVLFSSSVF